MSSLFSREWMIAWLKPRSRIRPRVDPTRTAMETTPKSSGDRIFANISVVPKERTLDSTDVRLIQKYDRDIVVVGR
jgi:hypothetical protein